MEEEMYVSSRIRLYVFDEFMCHVALVGLILCGVKIFPQRYGEDSVVRRLHR